MNKELIAVRNRMKALNDAYRKEKDPEKSTEIKDKMEPFYEEMGKITDRFIATHIDSYVTAGQLRYKVSSMTYPEAQAVFDRCRRTSCRSADSWCRCITTRNRKESKSSCIR